MYFKREAERKPFVYHALRRLYQAKLEVNVLYLAEDLQR